MTNLLLVNQCVDNMEKQEKVFVNGFISKEVNDNAPEFILGNASVKIDDLIAFLNDNRKYAVNGWLNWTIKRSKDGKRYTELDLYQFNKFQEGKKEPGRVATDTKTSPGYDGEVIDTADIPFD